MRALYSAGPSRTSVRSPVKLAGVVRFVIGSIGVGLLAAPMLAEVCSVPGDRDSIQFAVNDPACTTINLADLVYAESVLVQRSVSIVGPAGVAEIAGLVEVRGAGTVVDFTNIKVDNGCSPSAFVTSAGGQAEAGSLEVVTSGGGPCPPTSTVIFSDGFESGGTSVWTITVP